MISLKIINGNDNIDFYADNDIFITALDGIGTDCEIATTPNGIADGSAFVGARAAERSIQISFMFKIPSEAARYRVYKVCAAKTLVKIMYKSDLRDVYIYGYIDSCTMPQNAKPYAGVITIICPDPLFKSNTDSTVKFMDVAPLFKFPLALPSAVTYKMATVNGNRIGTFVNGGDIATGCIFEITARGNVSRPKLQNTVTFDWIQINVNMIAGDKITIDTRNGFKSVTLTRGAEVSDIINYIAWGSTFLQFAPGTNYITAAADSGINNIAVVGTFTTLYGGI